MNYKGKITEDHIELLSENKDGLGLSFHEIVLLKDTQPGAVKIERWINRLDEFYNVAWIGSINPLGVNLVYEIEELNERTTSFFTWKEISLQMFAEDLKDFKRMLFEGVVRDQRCSSIESSLERLKAQNTCVLAYRVHCNLT
jgi:hypothetical protein